MKAFRAGWLLSGVACVLLGSVALAQQGFTWQNDIEVAKRMAGQSNRLVLVHFWAEWCKPCVKLEQEVFSKPETQAALNSGFICVKINHDEAPGLAKLYGVTTLPADVILTPSGRLITKLPCPTEANKYIGQISAVSEQYRRVSEQMMAGANRATGAVNSTMAGVGATMDQASNALAQAPQQAMPPQYPPAQYQMPPQYQAAPQQPAMQAPPVQAAAPPQQQPVAQTQAAPVEKPEVPVVPAYGNDRYAEYFRKKQVQVNEAVDGVATRVEQTTDHVSTAANAQMQNATGAAANATATGERYAQQATETADRYSKQATDTADRYSAQAQGYAQQAQGYAEQAKQQSQAWQNTANNMASSLGGVAAAVNPAIATQQTPYGAPAGAIPSNAAPAGQPPANNMAMNPTMPQQAMMPPQAAIPPQAAPPQANLPPGAPAIAMEGYCSVQLKEQKRWVPGDRRWGAIHRGRTYLFGGPEEQKRFLANPDAYAPVNSGDDPVLALDHGQAVPGNRAHGIFYENRVFLFADEASLQAFYRNPSRYSAEVVQAMR